MDRLAWSLNRARERLRAFLVQAHPAKLVGLGYVSYITAGWLLLCLPFCHQTPGITVLDHLFIATSAVSTTGLVTISVSDSYNFLGELVVLFLVQLGGIGYMTFGSFLMLARSPELSAERSTVNRAVFGLPPSFPIERFVRNVIWFTVLVEAIGAVVLFGIFINAGVPQPLWSAVFHSVSAFCTAGFGLHNNSFESFASNVELNVVIAILSYLGAIGFLVFADGWNYFQLRAKSVMLTTRVILAATLWLTVIGTLLLYIFESTLWALPPGERFLAAFFQQMAAHTTVGFNTVPIGSLSKASILLLTVLMVVGASPAGTGGGLKSPSVVAVFGVMASIMRGRSEVRFWGHPVSAENILTAVAALGFYLAALVSGTYLLELTQGTATFDQNLFEVTSALGTVGLSMGITAALTLAGKLVIILMMLIGRIGPLTLGIAVFWQGPPASPARADPDLVV